MSNHTVKNRRVIEKHHTIGLATIDEIDWHLKNLWSGGFQTITDMNTKQHRKHTGVKARIKIIGNTKYWIPVKAGRM